MAQTRSKVTSAWLKSRPKLSTGLGRASVTGQSLRKSRKRRATEQLKKNEEQANSSKMKEQANSSEEQCKQQQDKRASEQQHEKSAGESQRKVNHWGGGRNGRGGGSHELTPADVHASTLTTPSGLSFNKNEEQANSSKRRF